jgi:hypothetical protein
MKTKTIKKHTDVFIPEIVPFKKGQITHCMDPTTIIINMDNPEELQWCTEEGKKVAKMALTVALRGAKPCEVEEIVEQFQADTAKNRVYGEFTVYTTNIHPEEYGIMKDFNFTPFLSVTTMVETRENEGHSATISHRIETVWM